jgi:2-ketocyclohexanecarboxyl-CoA hydrolase
MTKFEDIIYEERDGVARITINRPKVYNAFRAQTVEDLIEAVKRAGWNREIGVVVLGGVGEKAFCTGGDQSAHGDAGYDGRGTAGLPIEELQSAIRDIPKPVIASEQAIFGQVGPKVGSVDPGFGTAYLARIVGEKRAREIWYMCRRYTAQQAYEMGLVNAVVPHDQLDAEVERWCQEILDKSPTAIAIAKRSFNADSENIRAIGSLGFEALALYYATEESQEGGRAFREKRAPEFRKYVRKRAS